MQKDATPMQKDAMKFLLDQVGWSQFVDICCFDGNMTMTAKTYRKLVSNPAVVNFLMKQFSSGFPCELNGRVFFDMDRAEINAIRKVLRGTEITKPLPMEYYGLFRQLNIGHHWLFDHDCFVRLSNLQRYKYDGEQVSLTDGFPCSFGQDMLHIYKVTGDGFCAKNCERHVRVTFDIRGHIKEVVDLENDLGGGAGKDSRVGGSFSSDDAAPIKRDPIPRGDPSVDATEGSGC